MNAVKSQMKFSVLFAAFLVNGLMMTHQLKLLSQAVNFEVSPGNSPRGGSLASNLSL